MGGESGDDMVCHFSIIRSDPVSAKFGVQVHSACTSENFFALTGLGLRKCIKIPASAWCR